MRSKSLVALLGAACGVVVSVLGAYAQTAPDGALQERIYKNRIYTDNRSIIEGKGRYLLMKGRYDELAPAMEAPNLAAPETTWEELITTLNRMCSVGATGVAFNLPGISPDGKSMAPEAHESFRKALDQILWRRMIPICRIFAPDAPTDPEYRQAVIDTAAQAIGHDVDCLYWVDGPDAPALAARLIERAPKVEPNFPPQILQGPKPVRITVAAPANADVLTVTEVPLDEQRTLPLLLVGRIAMPDDGDVSYIVPGTDEFYDRMEKAKADPIEAQPWTPDNSVLSEEERREGFIALFNGKDLSGWTILGDNKEGFVVRDGAIEWNARGGSMLRTRDRYENFILRLDWKIGAGKNNGVQVHLPRAGRGSKIGLEIQMMGVREEPPTKNSTGAVYDVVPPKVDASKEPGEWNSLELVIDWPHLKATQNGVLIHDLNMEENPELAYRLRRGFIGITDHGGYAAFRNIRIKPLE